MVSKFKLCSDYAPNGDQPVAIEKISCGLEHGVRDQVLLGVTGSGKTFTMANIIARLQCPTLIMTPNKILAAQLYEEMKEFFPYNAVEYFVSYYDYYQPEAYIAQTGFYIEKEAIVNQKIERLRHSATRSLIERRDVIVVASVSCIYGLGAPEFYLDTRLQIKVGDKCEISDLRRKLSEMQYSCAPINFITGTFRVLGENVEVFSSHSDNRAWRISLCFNEVERIVEFDPINGRITGEVECINLYANSHYVVPKSTMLQAVENISLELEDRLQYFKSCGKLVEAQQLESRTRLDIEMIKETGTCKGIENYSRYINGRDAGQPPPTLFEYFPKDALLFVDESHVAVPQLGAMFRGNAMRKQNLIEYGYRLPSAVDNRPLSFEEWESTKMVTVYVSATPGKYELAKVDGVFVEQVVRPTGLLDPLCTVRPATGQVDDVIYESKLVVAQNQRVLITTITKKMAEDLAEYMEEAGMKVAYMHSDIVTLERVELIYNLRKGIIDVLIGVNLLREGLDIPECRMVAILDADKEGFLRSETSLIQTIGRAARNEFGYVILYADNTTRSLESAMKVTAQRREKQLEYNKLHNITPRSIEKKIMSSLYDFSCGDVVEEIISGNTDDLYKEMIQCAEALDFERAALLRDKIKKSVKNCR